MKCELCSAALATTFLKKVVGSYVRDGKGKRHLVCPACQKKHGQDIRKQFA